jgi:ABC-type transporter Mla MlaB component
MDSASGRSSGAAPIRSTAYNKTTPQQLSSAQSDKTHPVELAPAPLLDSVRPGTSPPRGAATVAAPGAAVPVRPFEAPAAQQPSAPPAFVPTPVTGASSQPGSSTGFTASKLFAIDVEEFAHDPELEEAAIRFANGDNAGAEAGLMEVLGPKGSRVDHDDTWLTLFDLYRATGQQDRFENAAIDFAGRFGRSAPQWFSLPEMVARMQAPAAAESTSQAANWTCPATLGTQTIVAMNAALAKAPQPWRLNWSKLNAIDDAAVEPLTKLFTQWAAQPLQLRFIGSDHLEQVLKNATPSSDKDVNPALWKLRMEVLRVMHRPDEFELVALDYCVTYEVSPPSWDSARCDYKPLQADGSYVPGHTIIGDAFRDSLSSGLGYGDTNIIPGGALSQMSNISTVELSGQILGDASEALGTLDSRLEGADVMVISCARLMRIDFSAAGTLLNWVTSRQAEGRQVQFVEVHRLVAAFFNVIGISEHARVMARSD